MPRSVRGGASALGPRAEAGLTLGQMMDKLDGGRGTRCRRPGEHPRERPSDLRSEGRTRDPQEIVDSNFELYKRITDDRVFGDAVKNFLFDQYLRAQRNAEELIKRGESKTLEFTSTLRWSLKEDKQDDKGVTHAVLKCGLPEH